ncbi:hypothetical protein SAMN05421682_104161 [Chryseobacterium indoltheticum]|uniref:DUF304 domain-containing protein n=2 Tax=Chryseobacterium indoltheticum TaxID=254 RepID=A0A381F3W3_9FLAO|nr:hypothetical protein EG358_14020 [Chryseobacterium indoltheticum]SIQ34417.1 hypothetical protein SAMN05421682_104161 [Chryseobacterium indoltheticum]SUX41250.1 Uncharacterised protein [Chryseobacterium indoltheticum]
MRLSNRKKVPVYNFFNILLLMILSGGCIGFIVDKMRFDILDEKSYILIIIPAILLIINYLYGRQIFEYDSEGEALHFRNRNIIPFIDKPLNDEFPKYKLIKFEMVSILFFSRLYLTVSSKNGGSAILKYETSYLTRKEVNDLKTSLNKVINANKEKRHQE